MFDPTGMMIDPQREFFSGQGNIRTLENLAQALDDKDSQQDNRRR